VQRPAFSISDRVRVGMVLATLSCAVPNDAWSQPQAMSLRSVNFPDRYVQSQGEQVVIGTVATSTERANATFIRVAGLAGGNSVSFQSLVNPDYYLRHQNYLLKLQENDRSGLFSRDASFVERDRNDLNSSRMAHSYEAVNFPGFFLRHQNFVLKLQKYDPRDRLFDQDSSFELLPGLASTPGPNTKTGAAKSIRSQLARFSNPIEGPSYEGRFPWALDVTGHIQGIARLSGGGAYVMAASYDFSDSRTHDYLAIWDPGAGSLKFRDFDHVSGYVGGVASALDLVVVGIGGRKKGANFFLWTGASLVERPGLSPGCGNENPSIAWHERDQRYYLLACGIFMRSRYPGPDLARHPCADSQDSPCWQGVAGNVVGSTRSIGGESLIYDRCSNSLFHFSTKCKGASESGGSCNSPMLVVREIVLTKDAQGNPTDARVEGEPIEATLADANEVDEGPSFRWGGTVFAAPDGRLSAAASKKFFSPEGGGKGRRLRSSWYPTTWKSEAADSECR
jgi:hypothetical protein